MEKYPSEVTKVFFPGLIYHPSLKTIIYKPAGRPGAHMVQRA